MKPVSVSADFSIEPRALFTMILIVLIYKLFERFLTQFGTFARTSKDVLIVYESVVLGHEMSKNEGICARLSVSNWIFHVLFS